GRRVASISRVARAHATPRGRTGRQAFEGHRMTEAVSVAPLAPAQATRAFYLLGRVRVRVADHVMAGLDGAKIQELLGYLLLFRHQQHNREILADALWAGRSTAQSRKSLRQGLWRIQSALAPSGGDLLVVDLDWIGVNEGALGWLDIAEFESALTRTKGIRGRALRGQAA